MEWYLIGYKKPKDPLLKKIKQKTRETRGMVNENVFTIDLGQTITTPMVYGVRHGYLSANFLLLSFY